MIRKATLEDCESILELYNKIDSHTPELAYIKDDFIGYVKSDKCLVLVAEDNDSVVGFLLAYDHDNWGYIDILIVDPLYRNKGHGTQLLNAIWHFAPDCWVMAELCSDAVNADLNKFLDNHKYELLTPFDYSWWYSWRPK